MGVCEKDGQDSIYVRVLIVGGYFILLKEAVLIGDEEEDVQVSPNVVVVSVSKDMVFGSIVVMVQGYVRTRRLKKSPRRV